MERIYERNLQKWLQLTRDFDVEAELNALETIMAQRRTEKVCADICGKGEEREAKTEEKGATGEERKRACCDGGNGDDGEIRGKRLGDRCGKVLETVLQRYFQKH